MALSSTSKRHTMIDSNLTEQWNVLSTLQFAIWENDVFHGFVGFDDCKVRRLWTQEQINALKFIGELMSVFLLKNRAQEALAVSLENLKNVLEHQEIWFYILDSETYNIRYMNERTYQLLKLWVLADASIVEWDRQRAGLIACRDISSYKTNGGEE